MRDLYAKQLIVQMSLSVTEIFGEGILKRLVLKYLRWRYRKPASKWQSIQPGTIFKVTVYDGISTYKDTIKAISVCDSDKYADHIKIVGILDVDNDAVILHVDRYSPAGYHYYDEYGDDDCPSILWESIEIL